MATIILRPLGLPQNLSRDEKTQRKSRYALSQLQRVRAITHRAHVRDTQLPLVLIDLEPEPGTLTGTGIDDVKDDWAVGHWPCGYCDVDLSEGILEGVLRFSAVSARDGKKEQRAVDAAVEVLEGLGFKISPEDSQKDSGGGIVMTIPNEWWEQNEHLWNGPHDPPAAARPRRERRGGGAAYYFAAAGVLLIVWPLARGLLSTWTDWGMVACLVVMSAYAASIALATT